MAREETPVAARPQRVMALDGLRGVAILWVLLHQLVVVPAGSTLDRVLLWPANFGWGGVTLFFVLSGYLITGILLDTRNAPRRVSSFYARRALRILPLYLTLLTVVFGVAWVAGGAWGVGELTVIQTASFWLLLGNWSQAAAGDFLVGPLAVTWSVAIEEQFYLVWPWIVWSCRPRVLARICLVVTAAVLVARLIAQSSGASPVMLYTSTWTRLDALAIGSLAATAVRSGVAWERRKTVLWGTLVIGGLSAAAIDLAGTLARDTGLYFCPAPSLGLGITLGAIAAGAMLLLLHDPKLSPRLSRLLSAAWLRSFGLYSYGIYLTHGPIRAVIRDHVISPTGAEPTPLIELTLVAGSIVPAQVLYAAVCLPVCWLVGCLAYRWIESPLLAMKKRFPAEATS